MKSKYLGIVVVAILLLMTPISVISAISPMNIKVTHSVIPQSEFVITLDEGEEVIWIADHVTREDDVAYVTMKTTGYLAEGFEGYLKIMPSYQPGLFCGVRNRITARALFGRPLFYARVSGFMWFNMNFRCTHVFPIMLYGSMSWRYEGYDGAKTTKKDEHYGEAIVDAYFEDQLNKWQPHIHVYAGYDWYDLDYYGGYLEWGD
jgi:hypothetical protein